MLRDVEVGLPVGEIGDGEQGLRHLNSVRSEELLVGLHQAALADGRQYLAGLDAVLLIAVAQCAPAGGDGARGNEQDFARGLPQPT